MLRNALSALGVVALLALIAGSIAALAVVKQRVHVTVALEEKTGARTADPLDELRLDVAELKSDLTAIATSLEGSFAALDERDTASTADAGRVKLALEELEDQVEAAAAAREARWMTELARLNAAVLELSAGAGNSPPPAPPPRERRQVDESSRESSRAPTDEIAKPAVPPPAATPAATGAPPKRFLRFELPSSSFSFERRQTLTILPSLSRVGFDAKSTLHDFTGVTSRIEGTLEVDLSHPDQSPTGLVEIEAASLDTGMEGRDTEMRGVLAVTDHPKIRFAWSGFEVKEVDVATRRVEGTASGELSIRGKTRSIAMPATVSVDASRRVVIEGEARLRMTDFGVSVPSKLGLISVEDEVKIWIALRARATPVESEPAAAATRTGEPADHAREK